LLFIILFPLLISGKLTGTLSGFIVRVKPAPFGLLCAWREVPILRQHLAHRGEGGLRASSPYKVVVWARAGGDVRGGGDPMAPTTDLLASCTRKARHCAQTTGPWPSSACTYSGYGSEPMWRRATSRVGHSSRFPISV
jgi:hypothetical protein